MSNRKRVLPSFKELKEDMKEMTFRQKVDHLWTYYGLYFCAILFLVVFLGAFLISTSINKNKEIMVSGIICNVNVSVKGYNYLSEDYAAYLGCNDNQVVELEGSDFSSLMDPTSAEDNYNAATKLTNLASAHMLDYAILDDFALRHYMGWDKTLFLDLRDCFTEEEMAEFKEKDMIWYVLYTDNEVEFASDDISSDDPRLVPVALKLDKTKFGQDTMQNQKAFFVIVGMNKGVDAAVAMWEYIEAWE